MMFFRRVEFETIIRLLAVGEGGEGGWAVGERLQQECTAATQDTDSWTQTDAVLCHYCLGFAVRGFSSIHCCVLREERDFA